MKQWCMKTPIGPLFLLASAKGLAGVYWQQRQVPMAEALSEHPVLTEAVRQLGEYFAGLRREFDLPLDNPGTAFQKRVWAELARIPYGQTVSYGDVAQRIQQNKAVRAVGTANGRNPLSIIVPCHRVIAADGGLGGYSGGLNIKVQLLELERGLRP